MGRQAHDPSGRRLRTGSLGAIVLLCAGFAIAVSDETANLTVMNRTPNILTIVIGDRTYKTVPAGAGVKYGSGDSDTVAVTASYAPGQGVTGSAQRTFHFVRASASQGSYTYIACGVNAPIGVHPVHWNVTADTLAAPGS